MNSATKAKVGFDDNEQKEFVKALRQPLMVQVILETFFSRLQAQAVLFTELHDKVERLQARNIEAEEMLDRVRLVEASVKELGGGKLSAFSQQDILRRLEAIEAGGYRGGGGLPEHSTRRLSNGQQLVDALGSNGADGTGQGHPDTLESRVLRSEQKLAGVYNLNGKLIAVEQMAEEMGIDIPDLDYDAFNAAAVSAATPPSTSASALAPAPPAPSSSAAELEADSALPASDPSTSAIWPTIKNNRKARDPYAGSTQTFGHGDGSTARVNRLTDMHFAMEKMRSTCTALQEKSDALQGEVERLKQELEESRAASEDKWAKVEAAAQEHRHKFDDDLTIVWKELRRSPEVSYADYMLLKGQVEQSLAQALDHAAMVETLRSEDMPTFKASVNDLSEQIKKAFEPRDLDTMFHQRVNEVEAMIKELQGELNLGAGGAKEGAMRPEDLSAMEEALEKKASLADLKALAQQYASLARSVSNMAEWLSVRPDTSDGLKNTGSAITKFKCMTCDRDMRTQSFGMGASQSAAKGSFLPKLDAMQGSREHMALTGGDLRRMADDRMGSNSSPPRGADFDDYLGGGGADSSPPRAHKPSGRVPIAAGGGAKGPLPGRTPVFF